MLYHQHVLNEHFDGGGKGILVLKMLEEEGELCPLYVEVAPIKLVVNGGEHV